MDRILATHVQVLYFEAIETTDPAAENMRVAGIAWTAAKSPPAVPCRP